MPPQKGLGARQIGAVADPRALEEAARLDRHKNDDISDICGKLEEDMEALKARFELYFLGIDKREPSRERGEMKRRVEKLKTENVRNTGLRFRIQTLHARFISYERMWLRSAREKEAGTYRRDVMRARRRAQAAEQEAAPAAAPPAALAPEAPAPQPPAPGLAPPDVVPPRPAPQPPTLPGGMSEARLRALYEEYVAAKKRQNEDVSRLTYEGLARSVSKQVPELMTKYRASAVDFKVVVRDGRVVLKATPIV